MQQIINVTWLLTFLNYKGILVKESTLIVSKNNQKCQHIQTLYFFYESVKIQNMANMLLLQAKILYTCALRSNNFDHNVMLALILYIA